MALVGAIAVRSLGLRTFRKQKFIERRIDWYEKMHRLLANVTLNYGLASSLEDGAGDRMNIAFKATQDMILVADEAFMYANDKGMEAIRSVVGSITNLMLEATKKAAVDPDTAEKIGDLCQRTQNALAREVRKEFATAPFRLSPRAPLLPH